MWLGIILSFVASMIIGATWYSKSVFGSIWLRHVYGDSSKCPECPKGAMVMTSLGSACTMIMLANILGAQLMSGTLVTAAVNGLKLGMLVSFMQVSHAVFSRTPATVYFINCGFDVTIIFAASVIMYLF